MGFEATALPKLAIKLELKRLKEIIIAFYYFYINFIVICYLVFFLPRGIRHNINVKSDNRS